MVKIIEKTLGEKEICVSVFLDVAQAVDKVWHEGLKNKLKLKQFAEVLTSYISFTLRVKQEEVYTDLKKIKTVVP